MTGHVAVITTLLGGWTLGGGEATTDIRPVTVDCKEYTVTARGTKGMFCTIPATYPEGVPHWDGFVFTVTRDGKDIGCVTGQYTGFKCYEDKPEDIVRRVLDSKARERVNSIWREATNLAAYSHPELLAAALKGIEGMQTNRGLYGRGGKLVRIVDGADIPSIASNLAVKGEVCNVMGHQWASVYKVEMLYDPSHIATRKCALCGKTETKRASWE